MKIAIGADHAGFALKEAIRGKLAEQGLEVVDYGTHSPESTDYPDYAGKVAREVAAGRAERGVLICSTGIGMSMAANKVHGIRAALATSPDAVELTRRHNNANVLTLGARYTTVEQGVELIDLFLKTPFDGGRHQRRVDKIAGLEQEGEEEQGER
jgi:ribose 5-phosphate isomerase B